LRHAKSMSVRLYARQGISEGRHYR
jgi:hypothetical protein